MTEEAKDNRAGIASEGMRRLIRQLPDIRGRWYLLAVKAGRETWALQNLRALGLEGYLPVWRRRVTRAGWIQHSGKRRWQRFEVTVTGPLFPGYLFVRIRVAADWAGVGTTAGVVAIVTSNGKPQPVARGDVEALQVMEREGLNEMMSIDELNARLAGLEAGDPVRVAMGGALDFLTGVFGAEVDAERCSVLISLCGRDSRVTVSKDRIVR